MTIARFLHVIGIALWLGGGAAALLLAGAAGRAAGAGRLDRLGLLSRTYGMTVAPGALLATVSGVALVMLASGQGLGSRLGAPAALGMEVLGLVAGLLEIFVTFPAAQRLGRVAAAAEPAEAPRAGERLRRRVAILLGVTLPLVAVATLLGVIPPRT